MTETRTHTVPFLVAFAIISTLMYWYHDQFWWPVDEGVYAYVAQRVLAGDILHRDLIDLHGGYGNLLNVGAFYLFGEDLLSLRYPLAAITVLQCLIAYKLLVPNGASIAATGAIAVGAFSFIQFPNPSANWHALGLFFLLCLLLENSSKKTASRLLMAGFILGLCFFTRQLSGVFLALGLVCVLLSENDTNERGSILPGLVIGTTALIGLLIYIASKQQVFGLIWAGIWPLALLTLAALRARMTWAVAGRISALVTAGFILSGLPLAIIALQKGAFSYWASDILFAALMINGQEFINHASFIGVLDLGWQNFTQGASVISVLSGGAWILLIMSVPVLGATATWLVWRDKTVPAPIILAVFFSVSALHYQIPIYLFFVLPAVFLALLIARPVQAMSVVLIALSAYMVVFQAGQPLERGLPATIAGLRAPANEPANLPRVSLRVQPSDARTYREVILAIDSVARVDEPLMTLPMDPELNFMTGRKSPVRYYGTPLGLRHSDDVRTTLLDLDAAAPLFVVHRRQDKYLTHLSAMLLEQVQDRSDPPVSIGQFDLYRYRGSQKSSESFAAR